MVEEMWGELYRESARGALAKLENLLPDEQVREVAWARNSLVATGMNRSDLKAVTPTLEKLRRAIREHRNVSINYQSNQVPHPTQRGLDPYALVHRWGWWYVIGFCHLRKEVRTFRVDRIAEISLSDATFNVPAEFDLQAHLKKELQAQPQDKAKLKVDADATRLFKGNQSYWESIEEQVDGSLIVTFSAPALEWAASTTLAYGPAVEVLEPPELRHMIAEWLQVTARKYVDHENVVTASRQSFG
jgi:predicted DNA-binding transcriptional regulator YafY